MTDVTAETTTEETAATETVIGAAEIAATEVTEVTSETGKVDEIDPFAAEKTEEAKADDAEKADADKTEPKTDEPDATPFEGLAAPEGFESLDADALAAATPVFRALGIDTTEKAQDALNKFAPIITDISTKAVTAAAAAQEAQIAEVSKTWAEQSRNHATLGGQNFDKSKTDVARFRDTFFKTDEAKALVRELPIFNHPVLFEAFALAGKALASDQIVHGDQNAGNKPVDFAQAAYGDFKATPAE